MIFNGSVDHGKAAKRGNRGLGLRDIRICVRIKVEYEFFLFLRSGNEVGLKVRYSQREDEGDEDG